MYRRVTAELSKTQNKLRELSLQCRCRKDRPQVSAGIQP
jgi:hypothetical protein